MKFSQYLFVAFLLFGLAAYNNNNGGHGFNGKHIISSSVPPAFGGDGKIMTINYTAMGINGLITVFDEIKRVAKAIMLNYIYYLKNSGIKSRQLQTKTP